MADVRIVKPSHLKDLLSTTLGNGIHTAGLVHVNGSLYASARTGESAQDLAAQVSAVLSTYWDNYQDSDSGVVSEPESLLLDCEHGRLVMRSLRQNLLLVLFGSETTPLGFLDEKARAYVTRLHRALPDHFR